MATFVTTLISWAGRRNRLSGIQYYLRVVKMGLVKNRAPKAVYASDRESGSLNYLTEEKTTSENSKSVTYSVASFTRSHSPSQAATMYGREGEMYRVQIPPARIYRGRVTDNTDPNPCFAHKTCLCHSILPSCILVDGGYTSYIHPVNRRLTKPYACQPFAVDPMAETVRWWYCPSSGAGMACKAITHTREQHGLEYICDGPSGESIHSPKDTASNTKDSTITSSAPFKASEDPIVQSQVLPWLHTFYPFKMWDKALSYPVKLETTRREEYPVLQGIRLS